MLEPESESNELRGRSSHSQSKAPKRVLVVASLLALIVLQPVLLVMEFPFYTERIQTHHPFGPFVWCEWLPLHRHSMLLTREAADLFHSLKIGETREELQGVMGWPCRVFYNAGDLRDLSDTTYDVSGANPPHASVVLFYDHDCQPKIPPEYGFFFWIDENGELVYKHLGGT